MASVAVEGGGDYLDTSSGSSSGGYSREISCSESVLWTTNCPLVLACNGLGDSGHFLRSLYTFRIQSVFLLFIKYTHDYPHAEGKELTVERSFSFWNFCRYLLNNSFFFFWRFFFGGVFCVMLFVNDAGGGRSNSLCSVFSFFPC